MAELTAAMQIAMKNGASASAAAENFDHFLQTTFSKKPITGSSARALICKALCLSISKTVWVLAKP